MYALANICVPRSWRKSGNGGGQKKQKRIRHFTVGYFIVFSRGFFTMQFNFSRV
jgi:hypothetical protein